MSVDAILKEIESLSDEERAELLGQLAELYSESDPIPELSPEMKAELDRRVAEADANPGAGIPWDVVYAESMKRVRK
jgi:putative addiction module component (TIGR02574 family)